jgi:ketosteroid isomerase-like protein
MTMTTSDSTTAELEDRLAITELINRLVLLLDARDWDALELLFTDTVYNDRTSLTGGEPETLGAAEFVGGWRYLMEHLDSVHHLVTCHVINLNGDTATCAANMQGTHVLANHSGGPIWQVGGRHDYQLTRTSDGWRIAGITFTIQWATGNQNILALSIAAGTTT